MDVSDTLTSPTRTLYVGADENLIQATLTIGIVGLGYVGLPTAIAFASKGHHVIGVDVSTARLEAIARRDVDLVPLDRDRLARLASFSTTTEASALRDCDAIVICVPTPVDRHLVPELGALKAACNAVVEVARPGQLILLTSTSYVGTTRDMVVEPLRARGLVPGEDVAVAFSPERIDPANTAFDHDEVPRVVGGLTPACSERARAVVSVATPAVHVVSSPEAAEMCKLVENTFRAVNITLANEFADISRVLDLDPIEVIEAAATKPYGFMPFFPGPGVGGHCIPCDPRYLQWQLRAHRTPTPLIDTAMSSIAHRPGHVVSRAMETLSSAGHGVSGARVLVIGVAYKRNVSDVRESPALEIIESLRERGALVDYHDLLIPTITLEDGATLETTAEVVPGDYDLVVLHTLHDDVNLDRLNFADLVLDATYRLNDHPFRIVP
jgi:UDP-N-acetyl-D-glucosamine dehydrogenase